MTDAAEESVAFEKISGIRREGDSPVVYVNSVQVKVGPYDFQLVLGQTAGMADKTLIVNNLVTVVMSPQHAKALSDVLSQHVQLFEELMGTIQVGPKENTTPPKRGSSGPSRPSSRSRTDASSKASRRGKARP